MKFLVVVRSGPDVVTVEREAALDLTVGELVRAVLAERGLPDRLADYSIRSDGQPLAEAAPLSAYFRPDQPRPTIVVEYVGSAGGGVFAPSPARPRRRDDSAGDFELAVSDEVRREVEVDAGDLDFQLSAADADEQMVLSEALQPPPVGAKARRSAGTRGETHAKQAAVRYYARMNPHRVYPLLVTLTGGAVERTAARGAAQTAGVTVEYEIDAPVEVEPVLPGCGVYPPKVVTRLGADDVVLTFYVAPAVLGAVPGASVRVAQNDTTLAAIPLDARVVRTAWAWASAAGAVVVPVVSSALKHYGVEADGRPDAGASLFVTAAQVLLAVPPAVWGVVLTAVAAGLYGLARPRRAEAFWEVTTTR